MTRVLLTLWCTFFLTSLAPGQTNTGCSGCFATIGLGANINARSVTDYTSTANIIQSTHLGNATPQYLVGVSYQLSARGIFYSRIHEKDTQVDATGKRTHPPCSPDFFNEDVDGALIYCYPWRAFVNAKFASDASQTFNGFTFGISHRLAKSLDLMLGVSYAAFNEVSPGFQRAAIQTVQSAQASGGNHSYDAFSLIALQHNWRNAFDGFPTQALNAGGQTGNLIYAGNALSVHYHPGAFVGIAIPVGLKSLLGGKS